MAEPERKMFTVHELTEMLVKQAGVHEGLWGIAIEFEFSAGNIPFPGPDNAFSFVPTAFASVGKVGIQKFDQPTPLTVDAAQVNPQKTARQSQTPRGREKRFADIGQ